MIQVFGFKIRRNHILSNYQIYILRFGTDKNSFVILNTGVLKILPSRSLFILSYSVVPVPAVFFAVEQKDLGLQQEPFFLRFRSL